MAYPWVNFKCSRSKQVSSTPTLIFGSALTCIVDSIIVVNTTSNQMLLDVTILSEIDLTPITFYLVRKMPIAPFAKQEILNTNIQNNVGVSTTETILYMLSGDLMHANSDFVGNKFDCHVNYRELAETAPTV